MQINGQYYVSAGLNKSFGQAIAYAHLKTSFNDYKARRGEFWGLLSEPQITKYHHEVFNQFDADVDYYGGTLFSGEGIKKWPLYPVRWVSEPFYCWDCDRNEEFESYKRAVAGNAVF